MVEDTEQAVAEGSADQASLQASPAVREDATAAPAVQEEGAGVAQRRVELMHNLCGLKQSHGSSPMHMLTERQALDIMKTMRRQHATSEYELARSAHDMAADLSKTKKEQPA